MVEDIVGRLAEFEPPFGYLKVDMKSVYVFDIDGTLADLTHRLHHIQKQPKDWDAFFDACAAYVSLPRRCEHREKCEQEIRPGFEAKP